MSATHHLTSKDCLSGDPYIAATAVPRMKAEERSFSPKQLSDGGFASRKFVPACLRQLM